MLRFGRALLLPALFAAGLIETVRPSLADTAALQQAARKEGEVTWYVGSIDAATAEAAGRSFTAQYGPKVNVVRAPPQVTFQRLTHDLSEHFKNADVFSSVDIGSFVLLKQNGALMTYKPENAAALLPAFQTLDKDNTFQTTVASTVVLGYNTSKLKPDEAPKSWTDLKSPKWAGRIALANPSFSGVASTWAAQMDRLYGQAYFVALKELRPQIERSVDDAVALVASGERSITASPAASILERADRGKPLDIVYPSDGAILVTTPSAILKNAPHPNAAKLFMEFLLGPEFGRILVGARYEPMRADVKPLPGAKSVRDVKTIRPSIEQATKGAAQAAKLWQSVFGP